MAEGGDLTSTVAQHYNQLQEAGLESRTQSRIFFMRNFNNWIKSVVINEFLTKIKANGTDGALSVLDLCSGKGGDLLKWKKGEIDQLVCADIAETSVEQSKERYNENVQRNKRDRYPSKMFGAEFIAADCTKLRLKDKYKDPSMLFNLTSCQFSFHYSFESLPQAEMMIKNACECLKPGGYFIGTTPNSNELVKRLRASEDLTFGNEVYRISFLTEDKQNLPLFGAKYDFHLEGVVDCPEFLVFFPAFEKLAEKYGMKLVYKKSFADFFNEHSKNSESRALLGKMQALEAYPGNADTPLVSQLESDYTHTKAHLDKLTAEQQSKHDQQQDQQQQHRNKNQRVGTLSQAEWDASTLYCVFAFQKAGGVAAAATDTDTQQRKRAHSPVTLSIPEEESPQKKRANSPFTLSIPEEESPQKKRSQSPYTLSIPEDSPQEKITMADT